MFDQEKNPRENPKVGHHQTSLSWPETDTENPDVLSKDEGRKRKRVTWADFVDSTTFHGVRFVFEKTSFKLRR